MAGIGCDILIVQNTPDNGYVVQKPDVEGYNGREVNLGISKNELEKTKKQAPKIILPWLIGTRHSRRVSEPKMV